MISRFVNSLLEQIRKQFDARGIYWARLHGGSELVAGFETVRQGSIYHWDGLKRAGDRHRPKWLFQLTLEGWGCFAAKLKRKVEAGSAFVIKIPSRHIYHADPACASWTFCWLMLSLPEVGIRLERHRGLVQHVGAFDCEGAAATALVRLITAMRRRATDFQLEAALFDWVLAMEREHFARRHPQRPRQRLRNQVRSAVLEALPRAIPVTEIAVTCGMQRSHFSHHFRKTTGLTPAAYMSEIRLNRSAELLRDERLSVKEIAAATGFGNASVFGKAFRRQFRMTPLEYRRLGGNPVAVRKNHR